MKMTHFRIREVEHYTPPSNERKPRIPNGKVASIRLTMLLSKLPSQLLFYLFLPETAPRRLLAEGEVEAAVTEGCGDVEVSWLDLLALPQWQGLALVKAGSNVTWAAKISAVPLIAASVLPGGPEGSGVLIAATALTGLAVTPVGGYITDSFGARWTAVTAAVVSGVGLMMVPAALLPENKQAKASLFTAACIVFASGAGVFGPAITALSQKYVPKSAEATALALPATVGNIVFLAAPSLLGEIADKLGKFKGWDCAVAGLVFIITAVFMFLA